MLPTLERVERVGERGRRGGTAADGDSPLLFFHGDESLPTRA